MHDDLAEAARLLLEFARRTGVVGTAPPRRYLWTDAFATCTALGLAGSHPDAAAIAAPLVAQVHAVLGRHRGDDGRHGWISGLAEDAGAQHPTMAGLRIGKPQPERRADEPFDARREWDRDGQYFHYLTRWMRALDRVSRTTGEGDAHRWAVELAEAAVAGFVVDAEPPRMAWKMSIDLSRPLVPSMGQHDPLDGWVACRLLRTDPAVDAAGTGERLDALVATMAWLSGGRDFRTDDPLGLGSLLVDAWTLRQIGSDEDAPIVAALLGMASAGLGAWLATSPLDAPASQRLAFRELGLAIGLQVLARFDACVGATQAANPSSGNPANAFDSDAMKSALASLRPRTVIADRIAQTWRDPANQRAASWRDHEDINTVMLAACLAPAGCLDVAREGR